jgi:hypothetical protein
MHFFLDAFSFITLLLKRVLEADLSAITFLKMAVKLPVVTAESSPWCHCSILRQGLKFLLTVLSSVMHLIYPSYILIIQWLSPLLYVYQCCISLTSLLSSFLSLHLNTHTDLYPVLPFLIFALKSLMNVWILTLLSSSNMLWDLITFPYNFYLVCFHLVYAMLSLIRNFPIVSWKQYS